MAAAVAALACFACVDDFRELRSSVALQRARIVADAPELIPARLTGGGTGAAAVLARVMRRPRRYESAVALLDLASRTSNVEEAARAKGTAYALGGEYARAAIAFSSIPDARRTASDWSDLAAVQWAAASGVTAPQRLLLALDATNRALTLAPMKEEALFNRALAAESLGLHPVAQKNWHRYLSTDHTSKWSSVARRRLSGSAGNDQSAWIAGTSNLDRLTTAQLMVLVRRYPEWARRYGEGVFLALWGERVHTDRASAARQLELARVIGATLRARNGESLLDDAVSAITGADQRCVTSLAQAHVAYRDGRMAYDADDLTLAERQLVNAATRFRRCGSPMGAVAELHVSSVRIDQNRTDDAMRDLTRLLSRHRSGGGTHKALGAGILWNIALCEAVRGHWSDSLTAARVAMTTYRALGERATAAGAEAILAEDYDLLGRPADAWRHGLSALRNASASGDLTRMRVVLAVLCRTELRGKRWHAARTLVDLEREVATVRDPTTDADMLLRAATVAHHLGDRAVAHGAIAGARAAVRTLPEESARNKLLADIDAVAGTIVRREDPSRADSLLTSAITFQQHAARPIVLPQLYLERARAYLQMHRRDAAEKDLRAGILELERERTHVHDAAIRPGIFDDAADLFDDLIALQVDQHASPAAILETVERGRARAVLEEMEADQGRTPEPLAVREIQRRLGPNGVLVEYVPLPDRMIVLVADSTSLTVHVVSASREDLRRTADDFTRALASGAPEPEVRRLSIALFEILIAPIRNRIGTATSIAFVPDATLQRLPFSALHDPAAGKFIVESATPTTHPSASVFMTTYDRSVRWRSKRAAHAIVFADPSLPWDLYPDLESLPGARRDAKAVAKHFRQTNVLMGPEATAARFMELAPHADVVQFSGHAVFDASEPERSALLLASTPSVHGTLTQRTIALMRLRRTRVVVLAACSTMAGRNALIEGVPSVARAFLIAGAPAVIGTLWDVEDGTATPLVNAIHAQLAKGTAPADALRAAQLEALHSADPGRRHPGHWSAFSAVGH